MIGCEVKLIRTTGKVALNIPMNSWHETWLNYQGDLDIQEDMDWISEAVFQFYQVHLDRTQEERIALG